MTENDPTTDQLADFVLAVACDEYADIELSTGDHLITDWEGDGVFNPYVVTDETPDNPDEYGDRIADAAQDALGVPVRIFEYVPDAGNLYYLSIRKQDVVGDNYLRSVRECHQ